VGIKSAVAMLVGCAACSGLDNPDDTWFKLEPQELGEGDWSCLGRPLVAAPAAQGTVTYQLGVEDWVTGEPVSDLTIQTCGSLDDECGTPRATQKLPNNRATSLVTLQLDVGFSGLLHFASNDGITLLADGTPDLTNAYVPNAYYFGDTVYRDRVVPTKVKLLRAPIVRQLAQNLPLDLDPQSALLVMVALDCDDKPAAGVRFSIDRQGVAYTLIGGRPQSPATPSELILTDGLGQGGFANVPPGYVFINAFLGRSETRINPTVISAAALPNQLTVVEVHAAPYGVNSN
jgi:hypothetical protein